MAEKHIHYFQKGSQRIGGRDRIQITKGIAERLPDDAFPIEEIAPGDVLEYKIIVDSDGIAGLKKITYSPKSPTRVKAKKIV